MINKLLNTGSVTPSAAIFMSGSGSNAEKLLESICDGKGARWKAALIFTDAPLKSRAEQISRNNGVPLVKLDILEFYRTRGETKVSLATEKGRQIREEWTDEVRKLIAPFNVDFGILAGFIPLTNITGDFPCLNVHPGDLTVEKDGRRLLVGLHTIPIETAIIAKFSSLRSSVIIAQPYTGRGGEMDSGPILGISSPVEIDLMGKNLDDLEIIYRKRPSQRPLGGYKDLVEEIAKHNQENLKVNGDWIVFPRAVNDFASGKFVQDESGHLLYLTDNSWKRIKTVEYGKASSKPLFI